MMAARTSGGSGKPGNNEPVHRLSDEYMTNICGAGRKYLQKMPLQAIKSIATKQALIECAGLIIALNRGDLWTPVHHRALQHNWRIVTEWLIADRACLVVATNYGIYQQAVRQCEPASCSSRRHSTSTPTT